MYYQDGFLKGLRKNHQNYRIARIPSRFEPITSRIFTSLHLHVLWLKLFKLKLLHDALTEIIKTNYVRCFVGEIVKLIKFF
jgi:hypothetical protein